MSKKKIVLGLILLGTLSGLGFITFTRGVHLWKLMVKFWVPASITIVAVTLVFLLGVVIWKRIRHIPRTARAGGRATPPPTPRSFRAFFRSIWNTWTKRIAYGVILFYTTISLVVWWYTRGLTMPWWFLVVVIGVGHLTLSVRVITETQRGVLILAGLILQELDSGPQLELQPFFRIHVETKNSIQVEFGTVDEKTKSRVERSTDKESWYVMPEPVRINWAGINSAKNVTPKEREFYKDDLYAQELTTDPHIYFSIRICNLTALIREVGGLDQAIDRIRDLCVTALSEYAGQTFLAKARGEIQEISAKIKTRVEDLVMDPQAVQRQQALPPDQQNEIIPWGINVIDLRIIDFGTPHRTNTAAAERAKAIAEADGQARATVTKAVADRKAAEETAEADGYRTITLAVAKQLELVAEGEGKADARKLELMGEAQGLEQIESTAGVDATAYLQLQTLKEGFAKGNTVFIPNTEMGAILAAALSVKTPKPEPPKSS